MNKKQFLELLIKLSGFEPRMVEIERFDGYVQYSGIGVQKIEDKEIDVLNFQGLSFEAALTDLLSQIYETDDIDFETNAALLNFL